MPIDIQTLRAQIRSQLKTEDLLLLLDQALDLIPQEHLPELFKNFLDIDSLTISESSEPLLLDDVIRFYDSSLAGIYYEDFRVNSRNYMDRSQGTINWISEFKRLMRRCINESNSGDLFVIRESFEFLINLLNEIDECRDDIIFFADEAGSWQVGVDWDKVIPCYFKSLAAVANPSEYAKCIISLVKNHVDYDSDKYIKQGLKNANPQQRKALKALIQSV